MVTKWVLLMALMQGMCEGLVCSDVESLKCPKGQHTLCKYQYDSTIGACTGQVNASRQYVKNRLLGFHNYVRNEFAAGNVKSWPVASNMKQMTWDDNLADVAVRWAYQCVGGHDDCRVTPQYPDVGQNAGWRQHTKTPPHGTLIFTQWLDEIILTSAAIVDKFEFRSDYSNYTALIWASTNKIGCGVVDSRSSGAYRTQLVCNYAPPGNMLEAPIYVRGDGCSKCENGMKCNPQSTYSKLCATPSDPADEVPVPVPISAVTKFPPRILLTFLPTICISNGT